jgi:hypothetical protein
LAPVPLPPYLQHLAERAARRTVDEVILTFIARNANFSWWMGIKLFFESR